MKNKLKILQEKAIISWNLEKEIMSLAAELKNKYLVVEFGITCAYENENHQLDGKRFKIKHANISSSTLWIYVEHDQYPDISFMVDIENIEKLKIEE